METMTAFVVKEAPGRYPVLEDLGQQIVNAVQTAEEDGDVPPTDRAREAVLLLLSETKQFLPDDGALYGDGDGGIRVEWAIGDRQLRLVIHRSDPAYDYLYHQEANGYALEPDLTPDTFGGWLRWLTGQIK